MSGSPGRIIILNGTSSSGKTTVANELQRTLPDFALHTGIDHFSEMVPNSFFAVSAGSSQVETEGLLQVLSEDESRVTGFRLGAKAVKIKEAMYRSVGEMARLGFDVIVDDVLLDERVVRLVAELLSEKAHFIGIRCSRKELGRREKARRDRLPGWAESQFDVVHRHGRYDLELDTEATSPSECARKIRQLIVDVPRPQALKTLRTAFTSG